jgi:transcriptional regulator with XRE-family HTH domain
VSEQPTKSPFAQRVREQREKLGISQQELARLCGFGLNQINRYERGIQDPTLPAVMKIAQVLNVSLDYLVGLSDDPHGYVTSSDLNVFEREIVDTFRRDGWIGVGRLMLDNLAK